MQPIPRWECCDRLLFACGEERPVAVLWIDIEPRRVMKMNDRDIGSLPRFVDEVRTEANDVSRVRRLLDRDRLDQGVVLPGLREEGAEREVQTDTVAAVGAPELPLIGVSSRARRLEDLAGLDETGFGRWRPRAVRDTEDEQQDEEGRQGKSCGSALVRERPHRAPLGKPAPTTARSQIGIKPRTGRIVVIPDTRVKRAGGGRVVAHLRQAQRGRGADELRALGRSL